MDTFTLSFIFIFLSFIVFLIISFISGYIFGRYKGEIITSEEHKKIKKVFSKPKGAVIRTKTPIERQREKEDSFHDSIEKREI